MEALRDGVFPFFLSPLSVEAPSLSPFASTAFSAHFVFPERRGRDGGREEGLYFESRRHERNSGCRKGSTTKSGN